MTLAQKLYDMLILGVIWGPAAALAVTIMAKVEGITGGERTAYALMAVLVVAAWTLTEYALEALKIDTAYAPE